MRMLLLAVILVATAISAGCGGMARTNWNCPGTAQQQRQRAELFDPYPQVVSRSEEPGTRPRSYDRPALDPEPRNLCPGQLPAPR